MRSQAYDCGNGEIPENVWCQNTASQIQGEDNRPVHHSDNGRQIAGTSTLCTTTRSTLGTLLLPSSGA